MLRDMGRPGKPEFVPLPTGPVRRDIKESFRVVDDDGNVLAEGPTWQSIEHAFLPLPDPNDPECWSSLRPRG